MEIKLFGRGDLLAFSQMFYTYFKEDFKIDIDEEKASRICDQIATDVEAGIVSLAILMVDHNYVGFINFQVDSPKSDWCEKEGWGFIREIYIKRKYRHLGFGKQLINYVENCFRKENIHQIYLTSDENDSFFDACGYRKTNQVSDINHDPIWDKILMG